MKNKTNYYLTPKDDDHPYNMYDAKLWNLPDTELLIMLRILSNKTKKVYEDDILWVVNRIEIQERLKERGTGERVFRKSWMELEKKHYIVKKRFKGGVEWTIYEDPELFLQTPKTSTKTLNRTKPVKTKEEKERVMKQPKVSTSKPIFRVLSNEEIEQLSPRQKDLYMYNLKNMPPEGYTS
jgi:hypothetical protein